MNSTDANTLGYTPEQLDRLMPESTAAEFLGISHRTLQNWRVRGGGPPYIKVAGKTVRYRFRDLLAWIEGSIRRHTSEPHPSC